MAKFPHQAVASPLITTAQKIGEFLAAYAGTFDNLHIQMDSANVNGPTTFDIKKNGASIFDGTLPSITAGASSYTASISVTVAQYDKIEVFTTAVPSGGVGAKLIVQMELDDGAVVGGTPIVNAANLAAFPATGATNTIYVADDTNFEYRWDGAAYVKLAGGGVTIPAGDLNTATNVVEKIQGRTIAMPTPAGNITENPTWSYNNGQGASGNTITKTAGNGWNSGSLSTQKIAGDVTVKYTRQSTSTSEYIQFGLVSADTLADNYGYDYSVRMEDSNAIIQEVGSTPSGFAVAVGDLIEIRKVSGQVKYYKNGTLVYTSGTNSSSALHFGCGIWKQNDTMSGFSMTYQSVDTIVDKALLWYQVGTSRYEQVTPAQLKTAMGLDGLSALPAGDLNPTTNKLEKVNGRTLAIPASPASLADNFPGSTINRDIWKEYQPAQAGHTFAAVSGGKATFTVDNTLQNNAGGWKTINFNLTDRFMSFELDFPNGLTGGGFQIFQVTTASGVKQVKFYNYYDGSYHPAVQSDFGGGGQITLADWAFLRVRHVSASNELFLDRSADGLSWTQIGSVACADATGANLAFLLLNDSFAMRVAQLNSNIVGTDSLADHSLLWAVGGELHVVTLADLKTAINALP